MNTAISLGLCAAAALIVLWGLRLAGAEEKALLSREKSDHLKVIAVLAIFLDHLAQHLASPGLLKVFVSTSYLFVGLFFFVSGYGLAKSARREGYLRHFLQRRLGRLLLPYLLAFVVCAAVSAVLRGGTDFRTLLLGLAGAEPICSSFWYVYAILWCYLAFWAAGRLARGSRLVLAGLVALYVAVCVLLGKKFNWYNAVLPFLAGVFAADREEKLPQGRGRRALAAAVCLAVSAVFFVMPFLAERFLGGADWVRALAGNIAAAAFALGLAGLVSLVRAGNPVSRAIARHSYEIYLYSVICCEVAALLKKDALIALAAVVLTAVCALVFRVLDEAITRRSAGRDAA